MKANKKLGQHFLCDPEILAEIAAISDLASTSGALEIGPGEGALTAFLAREGKPLTVLEKDRRAVDELGERFGDAITIVEGDALRVNLAELLPPVGADGRLPMVVGNLPYNVGSAIYHRLLSLDGQVSRLVLMLQLEVANRITATHGTRAYGLPSVMTSLRCRAWTVMNVPPSAFRPAPKVDSAVILVEFQDDPPLARGELRGFEGFLKRLFQARRKTLNNAFKSDLSVLQAQGIDGRLRPEQLSPMALLDLYRATARAEAEAPTPLDQC